MFHMLTEVWFGFFFIIIWLLVAACSISRVKAMLKARRRPFAAPLLPSKVILLSLLSLYALCYAALGEFSLICPLSNWRFIPELTFNVLVLHLLRPVVILLYCSIVSTSAAVNFPGNTTCNEKGLPESPSKHPNTAPSGEQGSMPPPDHRQSQAVGCTPLDENNAAAPPQPTRERAAGTCVELCKESDDQLSTNSYEGPAVSQPSLCREDKLNNMPPSCREAKDFANGNNAKQGAAFALVVEEELQPMSPTYSVRNGRMTLAGFEDEGEVYPQNALVEMSNLAFGSGVGSGVASPLVSKKTEVRMLAADSERTKALTSPGCPEPMSPSPQTTDNPHHCRRDNAEGNDARDDVTELWSRRMRRTVLLKLGCVIVPLTFFLPPSIYLAVHTNFRDIESCKEHILEFDVCWTAAAGEGVQYLHLPQAFAVISLVSNVLLLPIWVVYGIQCFRNIGNIKTKECFQRTYTIGVLLLVLLISYSCVSLFDSLRYNRVITSMLIILQNLCDASLAMLLVMRLGGSTKRTPRWYSKLISLRDRWSKCTR
ncbi:hypothetical protein TRVL_06885 [Trypanosoma vivax]|nr:hypothetical protein TRVL_06885 [Trypanosoma vivax]